MAVKDYLSSENARNKAQAALFTEMIKLAFGKEEQVIIGHHLTFESGGNLETENEIPSADTLMFCHDLMHRVFGVGAIPIMRDLASVPAGERDARLADYLNTQKRENNDHSDT